MPLHWPLITADSQFREQEFLPLGFSRGSVFLPIDTLPRTECILRLNKYSHRLKGAFILPAVGLFFMKVTVGQQITLFGVAC